ncbi:MAG: hypothetical protein QXP98_11055 [Thermoproteus sp.]
MALILLTSPGPNLTADPLIVTAPLPEPLLATRKVNVTFRGNLVVLKALVFSSTVTLDLGGGADVVVVFATAVVVVVTTAVVVAASGTLVVVDALTMGPLVIDVVAAPVALDVVATPDVIELAPEGPLGVKLGRRT